MKTKNEYDYIVVGSGAAGGIIFNDLKDLTTDDVMKKIDNDLN